MNKNKKCGIYCIENIVNHKKYVGQSINIQSRWSHHKNNLKNNSHCNTYLQNSWNKFGEENFIFYIIELCNEDMLDDRETFYIKKFNTLFNENGYNIDTGGKINKHLSYITKQKISKSNTGKSPTEDTRMKISKNRTGKTTGKNHYMWGKKHNQDRIEKIRKYAISRNGENFKNKRKVICINTLEIFDSIRDAAKKYQCSEANISKCCTGERNYCGKLEDGTKIQWSYYEENKEYNLNENIKDKWTQRFIEQYTSNMELVALYKSMKDASNKTGISRQCISRVCHGKQLQSHGYIFKFAN